MILCIGPTQSGKTLILRKLQNQDIYVDPTEINFDTIPTVGTNIVNVVLTKKKRVDIIEVGGTMAPIWHNHYESCNGVIFVIDSSNLQQVSCAGILLMQILKHDLLQEKNFLLVFNKTDVVSMVGIDEMKYILRLNDICKHAKQHISVVDSSCLTGKGLKDINDWLMQFC